MKEEIIFIKEDEYQEIKRKLNKENDYLSYEEIYILYQDKFKT